ncbi:chromatin assembly factor 1 subunit A-domain-containing protein [Xylaria cf. heliscus]|nr:chromatin assembly factor 1 subunit A-domain-containing protein [Xylaria cf. heliscus]
MPLSPVSPNVQASQVGAGKRSLDHFVNAADTTACRDSIDAINREHLSALKSPTMSKSAAECEPQSSSVPVIEMGSPPGSSPLTEAGSVTPTIDSPSPNATPSKSTPPKATPADPIQPQATSKPPVPAAAKRKRTVTTEDKEKERSEKKQKQDEAAAEKTRIAAEKAAEKEKKAAEKATKAAEKARVEAEKEAIKAAKAAERAKADAVKEAKRLKKQEEELAAKAKKEKQQNLMASFLKKAPTTPSKTTDYPPPATKADTASPSTSKREAEAVKSAYELNFKPFFVKSGVTMAAPLFEMDDETKEAKSGILDEYIRGDRGEFTPTRPFNATDTFELAFPQQRGIIPPSVKKIMETIHGDDYQNKFGITNTRNELQAEKLSTSAQDQLNNVPMKYLRFYEDVRPAYFGTVTTPMTYHKLRKLSRHPAGRILPLAYDYDSEAEWVEDDGEDLDDAEDEEEDIDGDEEMDDFVDDSEAIPTIIRPGFETDSLPVSTGLCFENRKRLGPSSTVYQYRLEFLLDTLEHHSMINPFSTEYWPAPVKKVAAATAILSAQGTITSMLPPAAPRDAAASTTSTAPASDLKDGVPRDILEDFKRALLSDECKDYSKATVIEMLAKKFTSCTKAQVKVTLDTIAHRVTPADAPKKSVKIWALLPNFSLKGT